MKKKKTLLIVGLIVIIASLVFYSYSKVPTLPAEKAEIVTTTIKKTVSANGIVLSRSEANLAFSTSGELNSLNVNKGDFVNANQILATISNYDATQTVQSYKDARDIAKRDLELYVESYEDNKDTVGGSDEYTLNIKRLQEFVSKAEATYQSALGSLAKTYISAPFDGTVVDIFKEVGEVVSIGQDVIKIADLENLIFEIEVDQEDFGYLKLGQDVEVELDSYVDVTFKGETVELPKYADSTTESFTIRIKIDQNEANPVLLGMKGEARVIVASSAPNTPALTFDAVFRDEHGKPFVWVLTDNKLKKENIDIGIEGDIYTELKSDLVDKTILVPTGNIEFVEGYKVILEK